MKHFMLFIAGIVLSFNVFAGINGETIKFPSELVKEQKILLNESTDFLANLATNIYMNNKYFIKMSPKQRAAFNCMVENVYQEARGEDLKGKILVGDVVLNRVNNEDYPSTICGVIYQPHQFSWTSNKKNIQHFHKISTVINKNDVEIRDSIYSAFYTVLFHGNSITDATAYYAPKGVTKAPAWSKKFRYLGKHGGHKFYAAMDATLTKSQKGVGFNS